MADGYVEALRAAEQGDGRRDPAIMGWLRGKVRGSQAEADRLAADASEIAALLPEYERLSAERPAGCKCLGLGGWGVLIAPRGTRFWEHWCSCPDAARYLAEWRTGERSTETRFAEIDARQAEVEGHFASKQRLRDARIPEHFAACTFASFRGQPNIGAKLPVADVVEAFGRDGSTANGKGSLFLFGSAGAGKSGLAVACLRAWLERGEPGLYCWVPSFFRALKSSFDHRDDPDVPKPSDISAPLVSAGLLVLDDLGGEHPTRWTRDVLFELIGYRHDHKLPTVFTSNFDLADTAARLLQPGDDPVEAERIAWRIAEVADVHELGGRNLRQVAA